ncbi:MAG: DNA replication and repair protein RecF [Chloroflexi bacterium]|jgi:DNA replication and repair protein RecF|nr:MAG: DNA replication and repair protein RecF [Chloroflexota bacterium]
MWISHLSLRNFRNYQHLELTLPKGLVVVEGNNAQGKTNLLEALYLLSILKSFRASAERDLVNRQAMEELEAATATATVDTGGEHIRVHVAFQPMAPLPSSERPGGPASVQKYVRVNGAPRSVSDSVGRLNAVLFSADDLEIVLGSPSARRRFMDILLCQIDRSYLRNLQRYQRVLTQRNHLLRDARGGRPGLEEEMAYWDDQVVSLGSEIIQRRAEIVATLSELAMATHGELTGGEESKASYVPSVGEEAGSLSDMADAFRQALTANRKRELAQGVTVVGPHRDDLALTVQGLPTATHGSRGQARTQALALRLAEAEVLAQHRGESPVLLLDDVLSEMDPNRREQVLERASRYQQAIVTTADIGQISEGFLHDAFRLRVTKGSLEPLPNGE